MKNRQSVPAVFHCYATILTATWLRLSFKDCTLSLTASTSLSLARAQLPSFFKKTVDQLPLWVFCASVSDAHHHPKVMAIASCNRHLFGPQKRPFSSLKNP